MFEFQNLMDQALKGAKKKPKEPSQEFNTGMQEWSETTFPSIYADQQPGELSPLQQARGSNMQNMNAGRDQTATVENPTSGTPGQVIYGNPSGTTVTAPEKKDPWADYYSAMENTINEGAANVTKYGAKGEASIGEAYNAQMDNASRQQSILARRAAEQSARMGGSAGGGMSQAGSAQAALSGQSLMNEAAVNRANMQLQLGRDLVVQETAINNQRLALADEKLNNARTDEEREQARQDKFLYQTMQGKIDMITNLINSGEISNPDEIMKKLTEATSG